MPPAPDPAAVAAALLAAHRSGAAHDGARLPEYAESPRADQWTLRAALVRVAQPEPVRASAVLELIRRTDTALAPHRRRLEHDLVPTVPTVSPAGVEPDRVSGLPRVWDHRTTDLARVSVRFPAGGDVVAAYTATAPLDDDERQLLPLLRPAVELDALAAVLTTWAATRPGPPPVDAIDRSCSTVFAMLAGAGVPRGTERDGGRRRRPPTG